jgi:predicted nucleic acid-binding protein
VADCFLDTNVLLYAVSTNPVEAEKAHAARALMQSADWAWSAQVAAEFIRASTSPRRPDPDRGNDFRCLFSDYCRLRRAA